MLRPHVIRAAVLVAWLLAAVAGENARALDEVARLRVVPEETRIEFVSSYGFLSPHLNIGGEVTGRVSVRSGDARANLADPTREASAEMVIDPRSLDTGNRWRDEVLRKEYLEVERYPEIRVRVTGVRDFRRSPDLGEGDDLSLEASLTLHGVTREVVTKTRKVERDGGVVVEAEATVRMTDFGMRLPELSPFLRARDEVRVEFHGVLERY